MARDLYAEAFEAALGSDVEPLDDPVLLDRAATILRGSAVANSASDAGSNHVPSGAEFGAAGPEALTSPAGRSNPATDDAPDHAGKRAVEGVS